MILRHREQQREQHNQNMRGGTGTVTVRHLLEADELHKKGRLFAEINIPAGASIGLHKHEGEIEAFYFISGSGDYYNNSEKKAVTAGDVVTVDDGNSHSVVNTGNTAIVMAALILYTGEAPVK